METRKNYNSKGQLIMEESSKWGKTTYNYDEKEQLIKQTNTYSSGVVNYTIEFKYDDNGILLSRFWTDSEGKIKKYYYHPDEALKLEIDSDGASYQPLYEKINKITHLEDGTEKVEVTYDTYPYKYIYTPAPKKPGFFTRLFS